MVSLNPLGSTCCTLIYPPFKLVPPKPPDAADFEGRNFAFSSQAGDRKGMDSENLRDLVGCQGLDLLHDVQGLPVSFNRL